MRIVGWQSGNLVLEDDSARTRRERGRLAEALWSEYFSARQAGHFGDGRASLGYNPPPPQPVGAGHVTFELRGFFTPPVIRRWISNGRGWRMTEVLVMSATLPRRYVPAHSVAIVIGAAMLGALCLIVNLTLVPLLGG